MSKHVQDAAKHPSRRAYVVPLATAAIITTATIAPQAALAEDDNDFGDATPAQAAVVQESEAETATTSQTVTAAETVKDYSDTTQTFDTKTEAQAYLDDAKSTYPTSDGYTVSTQGPTEVATGATHTETTTVAEGSETFDTKEAAQGYVDDNTKQYQGQEGYSVESDITERQTDSLVKSRDVTSGTVTGYESEDAANAAAQEATSAYQNNGRYYVTITTAADGTTTKTEKGTEVEETFETEDEAKAYIASLTAEGGAYAPKDGVTYDINATYGPKTIQVVVTEKQKKGNATMTAYGPYDSEDVAKEALAEDQEKDSSGDLHEVTYSDIEKTVATKEVESTETKTVTSDDAPFPSTQAYKRTAAENAAKEELEADGWTVASVDEYWYADPTWGGTIAVTGETTYTIPAGTWAIVKSSTGNYAMWYDNGPFAKRLQTLSYPTVEALAMENGSSLTGTRLERSGLNNKSIDSSRFKFTKNADGSYTVTITQGASDTITGIDWGYAPTKQGLSYTITATKTVTSTVPDTMTVKGDSYSDDYARTSARKAAVAELEAQGYEVVATDTYHADVTWGGIDNEQKSEYTIPANSWAIVKSSTGDYYIWSDGSWGTTTLKTPTTDTVIRNLAKEKDSSLTGSMYKGTGLGSLKSIRGSGTFKITKNDDGSYTLRVVSSGKSGSIVGVDWGAMPTEQTFSYTLDATKYVYSFTKTVQDYEEVAVTKQESATYAYKSDYERAKAKAEQALKDAGLDYQVQEIYNENVTWGGTESGKTTYTVPANSWIALVNDGQYMLWTPTSVKNPIIESFRAVAKDNDANLAAQKYYTYTAGLRRKSAGSFGGLTFAQNDDGTYTLTVDPTKVSYIDYGNIPTYTYVITSPKTEDKTVATASYTVDTTTTVPTYKADYSVIEYYGEPVYSYDASYKVTKSEQVADAEWQAAYKVTKANEYKVITKRDTSSNRGGWASMAGQTKQAARTSSEAKGTDGSDLPQTSDPTTSGAAGVLAMLGLGIAAAGVTTRRKAKHLRQ